MTFPLGSLCTHCAISVNVSRKTGITLKDTGVRDEHGLELIDGLFSSPEKSSRRPNGITNNTTISSEEDMELGDSMFNRAIVRFVVHHTRLRGQLESAHLLSKS